MAIPIARTHIRTVSVETEEADRSVSLDVVNLVNPAIKAEFQIVFAVDLVDRGR